MKNLKRVRAGVLASALAAMLAAGGTFAYFTDGDSAVNSFTVGKVSIDLQEPDFPEGGKEATNLVPLQEVVKDPSVLNTGTNDAFIYLEVTVPTLSVVTAAADGTRNNSGNATETQLFSFETDSSWTLVTNDLAADTIPSGEVISTFNSTGSFGTHVYDPESGEGSITYLYAYTGSDPAEMERVSPGERTSELFGAVRLANVIEDQGLEGSLQKIDVTAYAIQADYLNSGVGGTDGAAALGQTSPETVWKILSSQGPAADDRTGEDEATDI